MISSLKRKMRTALQQTPLFYLWLLPAWILLGLSRFMIVVLSFKSIAPWIGVHDGLAPRTPLCTAEQENRLLAIKVAIGVASKYAPWRSDCFPQAITARVILGCYSIPFALFFGMRRDEGDGQLKAHAWLVSGRVKVSGGHSFNQFTSVGCFVSGGGT